METQDSDRVIKVALEVVFGTHTLAQIPDALVSSCLCDGAVMMHMVHMIWCDAHVMMQCTTFIALDHSTHVHAVNV
jgi:hypothetical protein